MQYRNSKRNG